MTDIIQGDNNISKKKEKKCKLSGVYYALSIKGGPPLILNKKMARKFGAKVEYTVNRWIFQEKKDAEVIASQYTDRNRVVSVVESYFPELIDVWGKNKARSKIAKKRIRLEISNAKNNKELQNITLDIEKLGLHASWMKEDKLPEDMSKKDKNTHKFYKTQWDEIMYKSISLKTSERDIKCAEDVISDEEVPEFINELNKTYAVIRFPKTCVLTEARDEIENRDTVRLLTFESFNNWFCNDKDDDGTEISQKWLNHPNRRQYSNGLVFNPRKVGHYSGCYNLFHGFNVKPVQGDCGLFWELLDVLCGSDRVVSKYIRRWLAHLIQRPWEIPEVALVFKGEQGTGKSMFANCVSKLLEDYYFEVSSMKDVTGNFNNHLKDRLLICANESFWGGHKSEVGNLKALITETRQTIEQKGIDKIQVQNCKRWIFTSNEDWPVAIDIDDRRFVVCDVDTRLKENVEFFDALVEQMDNGGAEALMYDLVNEDIEGWHPRKEKPVTSDSWDVKLMGLKSYQKYLYECLKDETYVVYSSTDEWGDGEQKELSKKKLYGKYKEYCEDAKEKPVCDGLYWKQVEKMIGEKKVVDGKTIYLLERTRGTDPTNPKKRECLIKIPPISVARKRYSIFSKQDKATLWGSDTEN